MKKMLLIAVILAMIFMLTACRENDYLDDDLLGTGTAEGTNTNTNINANAEAATEVTSVTDSPTFSRHLANIRQLAETLEEPGLTEHDIQLSRLREFAKNLNDGGTELSDLRITRIWGHPGRTLGTWCDRTEQARQVSFDLTFANADDFNNAELIAEMLAFAGIPEDEIAISLGSTEWIILWGQVEHFDFMLVNRAVYEFAQPYLRLREFAMNTNRGTVYRDDVIVTMIDDIHMQRPIGEELPSYFSPRFRVGLSPAGFADRELTDEMLAFAGIERDNVEFMVVSAHSWYTEQDFLRINEEMSQFYQQFIRLQQFADLIPIRSVRRDIVMDNVWGSLSPAGSRGDGSGFHMGFRPEHYANDELRETFFIFTGIDRDNVDFEIAGEIVVGWTPTRNNLTPEQNMDFDALEAFKATANAPFWNDRYLHDPVIVNIGLDGRWNYDTGNFTLTQFIVALYDPELLDMTAEEAALRNTPLREEIIAATGVENIELRVFRPWTPWGDSW